MKKHVKVFMDYYDICIDDTFVCQYCDKRIVVDIHHILYKSQCGGDDINNLIGLCRICHDGHHRHNKPTTEEIKAKMLLTYLPF